MTDRLAIVTTPSTVYVRARAVPQSERTNETNDLRRGTINKQETVLCPKKAVAAAAARPIYVCML